MYNIIVWVHQATVDYTFRVNEPGRLCANILDHFKGDISFKSSEFKNKVVPRLREIQEKGLNKDSRVDISSKDGEDIIVVEDLRALREYLDLEIKDKNKKSAQIGGNPAISAIRGHFLRGGRAADETDLPVSLYAGLVPTTVGAELEKQQKEDEGLPLFKRRHIESTFKIPIPIEKSPQTIALEGSDRKLMIVYGPGRALADIEHQANDGLTVFVNKICNSLPADFKRIVIAITPPHDEAELNALDGLLSSVRARLGDRLVIFVGTNKLRDEEHDYALKLTEKLLSNADIISMNRDEAEFLHKLYNQEGFQETKPLAQKVRELPFRAIKICHGSHGAIMDLGCMPEHIITSRRFLNNPAEFLEETLTLAADGATYAVATNAELGRSATEAMIRVYSKHVESRDIELFRSAFLHTSNSAEPMPPGMIWVPSGQVQHQVSSITGAGAIFDSLFLSFLMRTEWG